MPSLIDEFQEKLANLYIRSYSLRNQDLSEAQERRKKGISYIDSYGHDEICWNARNLRRVGIGISFFERAIPYLRLGLSIDHLVREREVSIAKADADDYYRPTVYPSRDTGIYKEITGIHQDNNYINKPTFDKKNY